MIEVRLSAALGAGAPRDAPFHCSVLVFGPECPRAIPPARRFDDAAAFVSGVTITPRLEARDDNGRSTFRGLSGSSNTSRNFFQWSVLSDTYKVEHLDFGTGRPNCIYRYADPMTASLSAAVRF